LRFDKSIVIKAPPEKVWEMLAQDRHLEWFIGYKSVEYTSEVRTPEDKYRVGASAHVIGGREDFDATITESIENEKIAYSIEGEASKYVSERGIWQTYTLKPTEAGTELTIDMGWEITNLLIRLVENLLSILGRYSKKDFEKSLENLKNILEK